MAGNCSSRACGPGNGWRGVVGGSTLVKGSWLVPASSDGRCLCVSWSCMLLLFAAAAAAGVCRMDEPLPPSVGDGIARHELTLRSCYAELLGSEPEYTSCHDAFW